jgi:hypothetical protein
MDMTDTLLPDTTAPSAGESDAGCGCCIKPPADVDDRVAELEARRRAVERRLRGLQAPVS